MSTEYQNDVAPQKNTGDGDPKQFKGIMDSQEAFQTAMKKYGALYKEYANNKYKLKKAEMGISKTTEEGFPIDTEKLLELVNNCWEEIEKYTPEFEKIIKEYLREHPNNRIDIT